MPFDPPLPARRRSRRGAALRFAAAPLLLAGALALGAGQGAGTRTDLPARGADETGSCSFGDCHPAQRRATNPHLPVAEGVCGICHRLESADRHEFSLARDGRDLCALCHPEIDAAASVHNELLSADCIVCHDPHGTDFARLLRAPSIAEACEECHADVLEKPDSLHLPVATEPCGLCHDPHDTRSAAPAEAAPAELCLRCHETIAAEMPFAEHAHEPARSGRCDDCHDPHGSGAPANLREEVPALCFGCHDGIEQSVTGAEHRHSVAGAPDGCLVCHSPHGSSGSFLLRSDPLTLCAACHASEIVTESGTTVTAVAHEVETSTYLHGPVRQRECSACHDSHGSDHAKLLIERYTPEFYAGFDPEHYALCFSCHPQRKLLTEKSTNLTDFRNGDSNLHYLHVNKPANGRTCRACHATHGSNAPKHIRATVRYGRWDLPITFTKTETGGACASGCHTLRAYDREHPVAYSRPDAPGEAADPGTADEAGDPGRTPPGGADD